jgi:alpha-L-fucosidase
MTCSKEDKIAWFKNARFGMFIHWGLYSLIGRGEWVMRHELIPNEEYAKYAAKFDPKKFDADAWAVLAKEAGMKYMVLTTRHHDGFCLYDSAFSDFNSVKTAADRDFVKEYVAACRRAGLGVGLYYSLGDWRYGIPKITGTQEEADEMYAQAHAQVKELMSQYGKIDILWYDGAWCYPSLPDDGPEQVAKFWNAKKLNAMVRKLQPDILINNRSGSPEDFGTPEQHIKPEVRPWECCMTIGNERGWGYLKNDPTVKSAALLIDCLVTASSQGGNYLLNISPKADGTVPAGQVRRLKEIGEWLKVNGKSIYGAVKSEIGGGTVGFCSKVGDKHYLQILRWLGREVVITNVKQKIKSAVLLKNKQKLEVEYLSGDRALLKGLPGKAVDPYCTVVELKLEQK